MLPAPFRPQEANGGGGGRRASNSSSTTTTTTTTAAPLPPPTPPQAKRLQVPRACDRCKRLRRGCSDYRPCRRCVEAGFSDQCQPSPPHLPPSIPSAADVQADPGSQHRRLSALVTNQLLDHCIARYQEALYPTIPILTVAYIAQLRSAAVTPDTGLASLSVLAGMCAQTLLQTERSSFVRNQVGNEGVLQDPESLGRRLRDATALAYRDLSTAMPMTIEICLCAFFLYACEASLCHHSLAFRFLRDSATMMVLLPKTETSHVVDLVTRRLFWVVLISERSHAIRYRRPLTLQITEDSPSLDPGDGAPAGFWSLAALFRPFDTSFIALHNHEAHTIPPAPEGLSLVENSLNTALGPDLDLQSTEKANLRVTQLWLRVIVWQLRLRLGHLLEESYQHSLMFGYPIEVAKDLVLSTRDLPLESFQMHGAGLTEKLFDIASALIDVMARIPCTSSTVRTLGSGTLPENNLHYIRLLINRLPGGESIYDPLLGKHLQQAGLPEPVGDPITSPARPNN